MPSPSTSCTPYPGSPNHPGEVEKLGPVEVTHHFVEVLRARMHFVTAGNEQAPAVVMLHGFPETWYAWHAQIADLARDHHVIALDLKGYGQSEKRLDGEYSLPHQAFELALLLDEIGVDRFHLVGHDRGSVLGDYLCHVPGFEERILRYARLQQSFPKAHAEPRPPHALFASAAGTELFMSEAFPRLAYSEAPPFGVPRLVYQPIAEPVLDRIHREWHLPGVAQAVPLAFRATNFDVEMEERRRFLFRKMTMPVQLIQGALDPGQPPSDYEGLEALGPNFHIRWIEDAGHFLHLERPEAVSAAIRAFLTGADDDDGKTHA
jgi:pimeloyl-ACP methyl ester carboxylesterase